MNLPLVSILVPIYRVEPYIERCVRSVLGQTYSNLEYIFVDDATGDASVDVLERVLSDYPDRISKVQIIHHSQNKGLATARNIAVNACRGDFVFHVDSDDWVELNAVEAMMAKQQETDADIVTSEALDHRTDGNFKHFTGGWNLDKRELLEGVLNLTVSTTIWHRLIRRSLYIDNNVKCNESGSYKEDFQVFPLLVYFAKSVSGIEMELYHYNCMNKGSLTRSGSYCLEIQKQGLISIDCVISFFSDKEPYLREITAGLSIKYILQMMYYNMLNSNKEGYYYFQKKIDESDPKIWTIIHWNNPLKRLLSKNYYTMKLAYKIRLFCISIERQFKKSAVTDN